MTRRLLMKFALIAIAAIGGALPGISAFAPREQFISMFTSKTGPAGALGVATNAGYPDYWNMLNMRDGDIARSWGD